MRDESNERTWMIRAAGFPHTDKRGQTNIINDITALSAIGKNRRRAWELVDAEKAVDMIGLECKIHGVKWLNDNPREGEFLVSRGVTPEEAIELHDKWQKELYESLGRDEHGVRVRDRKSDSVSVTDYVYRKR